MLKVVSSTPCPPSLVDLDPYIPLQIKLAGAIDGEARFYWRAQEGNQSLVEIGIRPTDGCVLSVTVTTLNPAAVSRSSTFCVDEVEAVVAAPCVDLEMWSSASNDFASRFVDESCPVALAIGQTSADLWFTAEREVERWFAVGDARFGVTDQTLVCVQARCLSESQLVDLKSSVIEA